MAPPKGALRVTRTDVKNAPGDGSGSTDQGARAVAGFDLIGALAFRLARGKEILLDPGCLFVAQLDFGFDSHLFHRSDPRFRAEVSWKNQLVATRAVLDVERPA